MAKEVTQKQKDQWQKTREKAVKKFQENQKKNKKIVYKSRPVLKSKIKKVSKTQAKRLAQYHKQRKKWFENPDNQYCKLNMTEDCTADNPKEATDIHHTAGRVGSLLYEEKFWLPGDRVCHRLAHDKDKEAKQKGVSVLRLSK